VVRAKEFLLYRNGQAEAAGDTIVARADLQTLTQQTVPCPTCFPGSPMLSVVATCCGAAATIVVEARMHSDP
jgi:hypothetical protein